MERYDSQKQGNFHACSWKCNDVSVRLTGAHISPSPPRRRMGAWMRPLPAGAPAPLQLRSLPKPQPRAAAQTAAAGYSETRQGLEFTQEWLSKGSAPAPATTTLAFCARNIMNTYDKVFQNSMFLRSPMFSLSLRFSYRHILFDVFHVPMPRAHLLPATRR